MLDCFATQDGLAFIRQLRSGPGGLGSFSEGGAQDVPVMPRRLFSLPGWLVYAAPRWLYSGNGVVKPAAAWIGRRMGVAGTTRIFRPSGGEGGVSLFGDLRERKRSFFLLCRDSFFRLWVRL